MSGKKERHPVYRIIVFLLVVVLALGVLLLVWGKGHGGAPMPMVTLKS